MTNPDNIAYIAEHPVEGFAVLCTQTWTKIANAKRRKLLTMLACKQMETLEQLVADMTYEDVQRLLIDQSEITGSNGHHTESFGQEAAAEGPKPSGKKDSRPKKGTKAK